MFLDTPVCRAWVHCQSVRTFDHSADPNQENRVSVCCVCVCVCGCVCVCVRGVGVCEEAIV